MGQEQFKKFDMRVKRMNRIAHHNTESRLSRSHGKGGGYASENPEAIAENERDSPIHGNDRWKAAGAGETHQKVECRCENSDQRTMQNPAVRNLSKNPPCDDETDDQCSGADKRQDFLRSENLQRWYENSNKNEFKKECPANDSSPKHT